MIDRLPPVTNEKELTALVRKIGFLPMFSSGIPGYSLEDCTPKDYWFVEGVDGPWEWKGYVLDGTVAYGKVFHNKAGFIDRAWLPDFCNYRRDGYDFEGFFEDGFASYKSKAIVDTLARQGPLVSRALKEQCGYREGGEKGFDGVMTQLQMRSFVTIHSFAYNRDRFGRPYGWGLACYALMEQAFGGDIVNAAENRSPLESRERVKEQIRRVCPEADEKQIERLVD